MKTKTENTQLEKFLRVFIEKWYITAISVFLCLTIAFFYVSFIKTERYQAFTKLYVIEDLSGKDVSAETISLSINEKLAHDYSVIAVSNRVLKRVRQTLPNTVINARNISVTNVPDSRILILSVIDTDPETASSIANEITDVLIEEINDIIGKNNIKIIDHAETPTAPISVNLKILLVVSLLLGLLIGIFVCIVIELMDTKIKTPSDIEEKFDLPIIGLIPRNDISDFASGKEGKQ